MYIKKITENESTFKKSLFQDVFPDVELVRSIQEELDEVIRNGVANIVQLIRNADSGSTSSATRIR